MSVNRAPKSLTEWSPETVAEQHRYDVPAFCLAAGHRQVHVYRSGRGYVVLEFRKNKAVHTALVLRGKWVAVDRAIEMAVQAKVIPPYLGERARVRAKLAATEAP